jgi:hypothetical protein
MFIRGECRSVEKVLLQESPMMKKLFARVLLSAFVLFLGNIPPSYSKDKPLIYPLPLLIQRTSGEFAITATTSIIVPQTETRGDKFLRELVANEFIDRHHISLGVARETKLPSGGNFILVGTVDNPLVQQYCKQNGLDAELKGLGDEGYILVVSGKSVVVAANKQNGALFGFESLRQIIKEEQGRILIPQLKVKDTPRFPFRGIKLYLPGRENITFFKRFIRDFAALYKYNTIIIELNANMRLERHPELNIGAVDFAKALNYSRLSEPNGIKNKTKNSTHHDNADGGILEKEEVADLVSYMRKYNLEVIPELPSLPHSYYLLAGHKNLAENGKEVFPDTYCPLQPEIYKIYFDVLDEYIDVIHPTTIHVGHDEWRMEKDECERCKGKDYGELFANDLTKIHDYLATKGIATAMWGDHLLESVRSKDPRVTKSSTGYVYKVPGGLRPEQVEKLIPKDILVFNWFWDERYERSNDTKLSQWGFKQVYGNMRADIIDWVERTKVPGFLGGAPSSWAATTEMNFGKDQLVNFLGCANFLWSEHHMPFDSLIFTMESLVHDVQKDFTGVLMPSDEGFSVRTLDLSSKYNSSLAEGTAGLSANDILTGDVKAGNKVFKLAAPENEKKAIKAVTSGQFSDTKEVTEIPINEDVSSIVFLQACARNVANRKVYYNIYNFDETADLLGWYEVVYEDGFIETIPIRYGVNILDWGWRQRISKNEKEKIHYNQDKYAYAAEAVSVSKDNARPVTFFASEWRNTRFGEKIKHINLKTVNYNKSNENAILLLGLSVVEKTDILNALTKSGD